MQSESLYSPLIPWITSPRRSGNRNTPISSPCVDRLWILLRSRVDANIDGSVDARAPVAANLCNLELRVVTTLLGRVVQHIISIQSLSLFVGVVWCCLFHIGKCGLVNVKLTDMRNGTTLDGVVRKLSSAMVDDSCRWLV
jgi:hypothetical protein